MSSLHNVTLHSYPIKLVLVVESLAERGNAPWTGKGELSLFLLKVDLLVEFGEDELVRLRKRSLSASVTRVLRGEGKADRLGNESVDFGDTLMACPLCR